ncbi:MAG: ribosome biogenesis GTP-binding protein YihA/YsxC [Acidobacteriia bacterium]|nr:ribosome biogenesis GTP-binding protein YihA/YsxC [Terriglobia bacterium]
MKIVSCRFERSAYRAEDEPRDPGPYVAFLGRSNVGKSSLINRLLGVPNLARTSSTPGRTQSVNFYRINEAFWFVDLPGYGYAAVPEEIRRSWRPMAEGFLERRGGRIELAILVVDARQGATELDLTMRDWLAGAGVSYLVAATKADKLSGNGRAAAQRGLNEALGPSPAEEGPILVSAKTGQGLRAIWSHLDRALDRGAPTKGKGRAWTSES